MMDVDTIKGDRKHQIIAEATRLFSLEGYDRVSTRQLADACQISEAGLYKHFNSKAEIYDAVLDSLPARLQCDALFEQLSDVDDLEQILMMTAEFLIRFLTDNVDLYRLLLFSALSGHEKAKNISSEIRGRFINFITEHLKRLRQQAQVVDTDPKITARCFIGMIMDCAMGINLLESGVGERIEPSHAIANNIPIYVRGLINKNEK
ncbi:MAG: TetR family transcriptional regulator [candidate division Zixibacteria bacterium]|nr:TetR family transcriptional regulator [candidate division Zixibacteria bacterium]